MKNLSIIVCMLSLLLFAGGCDKGSEGDHNLFGLIHGTVNDQQTGEPITNASVLLSPGGKTQTTGTDGSFEFVSLDAQQYTITVQKDGYSTNRKTVTVFAGEKTEASIPLTKN